MKTIIMDSANKYLVVALYKEIDYENNYHG